jgi:hypothetical protein
VSGVEPASPTAVSPEAAGRGRRFVRFYGAKPWHLLTLLGSLALAGYTVSRLLEDTSAVVRIAVWFVGAAVVWDFVLGPLLALGDRGVRGALERRAGLSALTAVRFPALLSLLLLLMWTPLVFQRSEQIYQAKSGLLQDPYLERWAAVTVVLFAGSALAYVVLRGRRRS